MFDTSVKIEIIAWHTNKFKSLLCLVLLCIRLLLSPSSVYLMVEASISQFESSQSVI